MDLYVLAIFIITAVLIIVIWNLETVKLAVFRWNKFNYGITVSCVKPIDAPVWPTNKELQYIGAACIRVSFDDTYDITGKNIETAIFMGGDIGQDDALLIYRDSKLVNRIDSTNLSDRANATYACLSVDLNKDGLDDLIVCRSNGVFVYLQSNSLDFTIKEIMPESDRVPISIAVSDIVNGVNNLYVSNFAHPSTINSLDFSPDLNGKSKSKSINKIFAVLDLDLDFSNKKSDQKLIDITSTIGDVANSNTLTAAFVDLNGDKYPDLVINTLNGTEIYKNNNGKFELVKGSISERTDKDGDLAIYKTANNSKIEEFIMQNNGNVQKVSITSTKPIVNTSRIVAMSSTKERFNDTLNPSTRMAGGINTGIASTRRAISTSNQNASLCGKGMGEDPLLGGAGEYLSTGRNSRTAYTSDTYRTSDELTSNSITKSNCGYVNSGFVKTSISTPSYSTMPSNTFEPGTTMDGSAGTQTFAKPTNIKSYLDQDLANQPDPLTIADNLDIISKASTFNNELYPVTDTGPSVSDIITLSGSTAVRNSSILNDDSHNSENVTGVTATPSQIPIANSKNENNVKLNSDAVFINMIHRPIAYLNDGVLTEPEIRAYLAGKQGNPEYKHIFNEFLNVSLPTGIEWRNSIINIHYKQNNSELIQRKNSIVSDYAYGSSSSYIYNFTFGADKKTQILKVVVKTDDKTITYEGAQLNTTVAIVRAH